MVRERRRPALLVTRAILREAMHVHRLCCATAANARAVPLVSAVAIRLEVHAKTELPSHASDMRGSSTCQFDARDVSLRADTNAKAPSVFTEGASRAGTTRVEQTLAVLL